MRRALPVIFLAACGGSSTPPPTGAMTVSVERYEYTFDLESRAARAVVHLTVTGEGNCVTLPLRADYEGGGLLDGEAAEVETAGGEITMCGAGWAAGAELLLEADLTVPLETWGASQVGYSVGTDANGAPFYYLVSWVGGCDRFAPCDHAPDVFARYDFTITHPADVTVLCPGVVSATATSTTCTFDHDGGPTYSTFGVVASSGWEVVDALPWNGLDVTIYNRIGSGVAAAIDEAWIGDFLAWMEDRFGPYPYGDSLRVVTGPTYWAGFEHPGNIVLDDRLNVVPPLANTYTDPVNHTLAHEIAHQWAGDQTTLRDTYDFVWKEAMVEYLTYCFEDETLPVNARRTVSLWKTWAFGAAFHPVPEDEPPPTLLEYYGDAYGPGPMVLFRQLEAMFTRAQVLDAIGQLLGTPHAISVDEVQAALEDTTGEDLDTYFDLWVRGAGAPAWPRFSISLVSGNVQVTQVDTRFDCAFHVRVQGADPSEQLDVGPFRFADGEQIVTILHNAPFTVVSTILDPRNECLGYLASGLAAPRHPPGWSPWVSLHQGVE